MLLAASPNRPQTPLRLRHMIEAGMRLVRSEQNRDGGWGQQAGDESDPRSTSYAIIAMCGQVDPAPVARGVEYLLARQRPDGSIPSASDSIGPRPFTFTVPVLGDIFALLALGHVARRVEAPRDTLV